MKYITYEQAKWLKEKGYNEPCYKVYNGKKLSFLRSNGKTDWLRNSYYTHLLKQNPDHNELKRIFTAPEQHHVVDWLLEKHGIWVEVRRTSHFNEIRFQAYYNEKPVTGIMGGYLSVLTPKDAYSSAFDYIKDNNLI